MRAVKQRHKSGCGIASLAMFLGIGYNKIYKEVEILRRRKKKEKFNGMNLEDIIRILKRHKVNYEISFSRRGMDKARKAMIIVNYDDGRHCFLMKNGKITDPMPMKWLWAKIDGEYINKNFSLMITEKE